MKKQIKFILSILIIFMSTIQTGISATTTNSIPEEAKPIHKGGSVFGGTGEDVLGDAGTTNKNGITAIVTSPYNTTADFTFPSVFGYPHTVMTLLDADAKVIKHLRFTKHQHSDDLYSVISDDNGDFYVSGFSYDSAYQYPNTTVGIAPYEQQPKGPGANGFVSKFDQDGNILWYTIIDGTGNERVTSIGFDSNKNIIFSGYTNSPIANSPFVGTQHGEHDIFIGKMSASDGSITKAPKLYGGSGHEVTSGSADFAYMDKTIRQEIFVKNGKIYISFRSTSPIDGDITERISRGSDYDIGIMQFDEDLNLIKHKSFGGNDTDEANGILLTLSDTIFMPFVSKSTNLIPELQANKGAKDIRYMELDLDLNYLTGDVIGGSGDDILQNYQLLPSGDIVLSGYTKSNDGDFSNKETTNQMGFFSYYDINTKQIKLSKYMGKIIGRYVYLSEGNYILIGSTTTLDGLGEMEGSLKGEEDIFASKFGPTASTPSFITAKAHADVRQNTGVADARTLLGAAIGDYDSFVTQDDLIVTPATIPTDELKSHKIILSSADAAPVTSYIHVTQNTNPIVSGNQVLDSAGDFTISSGSNLTADQLITINKISAWNFETNEKYNVTVDAADLALVNAVTTTTTTVPVKVSSKNGNNETVTKTINIQVMSQAAAVSEIEAAAVAAWGGDQSEFVTLANFTISIGAKTVSGILNDIRNTSYTSAQAIAVLNRSLIDVDRDKNGKTDYNIDINKDGVADINVDTNKDGTVDVNLVQSTSKSGMNYDKNGDGYPDTNIDIDGNGTAELNIDLNSDGTADIEIDLNFDGVADLNLDTNSDQVADVNVDTNKDGKANINIDTNGDRVADINIDTTGDKKADLNLDTNNDRVADVNVDTNGDRVADINIDTNKDNVADINIDTNSDGIADLNLDINGDKKADINIDINNDGVADINIDTNNDNIADINIDVNNDMKADINIDINADRIADLNIDTDNDGKPNVNLAIYKSGEADFNIDTDNDGIADGNLIQSSNLAGLNYDKNGNGYPDINIDVNGDGVADINIDTNGDGVADINIDTNGDGIADINIDTNGDGIADTNIEVVNDSSKNLVSTGMSAVLTLFAGLLTMAVFMIRKVISIVR